MVAGGLHFVADIIVLEGKGVEKILVDKKIRVI